MVFASPFELSGLDTSQGFVFVGSTEGGRVGRVVDASGDLNGDGIEDLVIASQSVGYLGSSNNGGVFVVFGATDIAGFIGSEGLLNGANGFAIHGNPEERIGVDVATGDLNGDGIDDLIVGAGYAGGNAGRTQIYLGRAEPFAASLPVLPAPGTGWVVYGYSSGAGHSVASLDLDHDGIDDLVIGAPGDSSGAGAVFVTFGHTTVPMTDQVLTGYAPGEGVALRTSQGSGLFGFTVDAAGDFNGDGIEDLIIGAPVHDLPAGENAGQAFIVFGRSAGFSAEVDLAALSGAEGLIVNGAGVNDFLGAAAVAAGDVNGDGIDDVIIRAPYSLLGMAGGIGEEAYVVFGRTAGRATPLETSDLDASDGFALRSTIGGGIAIGAAGDANGDGIDDFLFGVSYADPNTIGNAGVAYLIYGRTSFPSVVDVDDLSSTEAVAFRGQSEQEGLPSAVSAGDLNGDGGRDIVLGVAEASAFDDQSGAAYVLFGDPRTAEITSWDDDTGVFGDGITTDRELLLQGTASVGSTVLVFRDGIPIGEAGVAGDGSWVFGTPRLGFGDHRFTVRAGRDGDFGAESPPLDVTIVTGTPGSFPAVITPALDIDGANGFAIHGASAGDFAGYGVSGIGDVNGDGIDDLVVGAPRVSEHGQYSGAAYVVYGRLDGFPAHVDLSALDASEGFALLGSSETDRAGMRVSDAGDINGDGIDDLMVSAPYVDRPPGEINAGATYVVFGRTSPTAAVIELTELGASLGFRILGVDYGDAAGRSIGNAGDVNGDGMEDLLIGAMFRSPNGMYSGSAYVVYGRTSGFPETFDLTSIDGGNGFRLDGANEEDRAGQSLAAVGDMNGDGIDDVAVGAYRSDPRGPQSGSVHVIFGRTEGFAAVEQLATIPGNDGGFRFVGRTNMAETGWTIDGAGDVNGDGIDDMVVGSRDYGNGASIAYVVFGRSEGFPTTVDATSLDGASNGFVIIGPTALDRPQIAGAGIGDVNGDGVDDLLFGALLAPAGGDEFAGQAFVVFGRTGGFAAELSLAAMPASLGFRMDAENGGDFLGGSVAAAGDVNGDGAADLIVGAAGESPHGLGFAGTAYVLFGSAGAGPPVATIAEFADDTGADDQVTTDRELDLIGTATGLSIVHVFRDGIEIGTAAATDEGAWTFATPRLGFGTHDFTVRAELGGDTGPASDDFTVTIETSPAGEFPLSVPVDVLDDGRFGFAVHGVSVNDGVGYAVEGAGDVNGDGIDDLIIGVSRNAQSGVAGNAYVIFGRTEGLPGDLDISAIGPDVGFAINGASVDDRAGRSVAAAGDVNGDGIDDVIVGAAYADPLGRNLGGAAYIVFGGTDTGPVDLSDLDAGEGVAIFGATSFTRTGIAVDGIGDINDDGIDDVIIGAEDAGFAYVVFGRSDGMPAEIDLATLAPEDGFRLQAAPGDERLGIGVTGAGDLNGDGIADLALNAYVGEFPPSAGSAYVVFGRSSFDATLQLSALDGANGFRLGGEGLPTLPGRRVDSAGDVNGDGIDDLIVGSKAIAGGVGESYVVFGRSDGFAAALSLSALSGTDGFAIIGTDNDDRVGDAVAGAGDLNGDGIDDLIVGAPGVGNPGIQRGVAYVIFGRSDGFDARLELSGFDTPDGFRIEGAASFDNLGTAVGGAGDLNGDGIADAVVGARGHFPHGILNGGAAYVIYGTTGALDLVPPDTTILTGPNDPTNDTTPDFTFTSDEAGTFEVAVDGGAFSSIGSGTSYAVPTLGDGTHTVAIRARDDVGNVDESPALYTFTLDTGAPDTTILLGPTGALGEDTAFFSFGADEPGTFEIELDGGGFTTVGGATTYTTPTLSEGLHTFAVRATDGVGNTDDTPALRTFRVDTTDPDTTIFSQPAALTNDPTADFTFGSDDEGTFDVGVDGGPFMGIGAATSYSTTTLSDGTHTFRVRAIDAAGNIDPTPVFATFVVDTVAPDTTITSGPSGLIGVNDVSFDFGSAESVAGFEVALDGGAFGPVSGSSRSYTDLSEGAHTFRVRAVDQAGNADPTPAARVFSIDTHPPIQAVITSFTEDTGTIGDGVTTDRTLAIAGTANAGNRIHVFRDGVEIGTTVVSGAGTWSFADPATQSIGTHRYTAQAENSAGVDAPMSLPLDVFVVDPASVPGGGSDLVIGTSAANQIQGGEGNDTIFGEAGNDTVRGQNGNDSLLGGEGSDRIEFGNGNDAGHGGNGNDSVYGENGNDRLLGDGGNDVLEGGGGADTIDGGAGADTINGGADNDRIFGGAGADRLLGDAGLDWIDPGVDLVHDSIVGTLAHLQGDTIDGFIGGAPSDPAADLLLVTNMTNAQRNQIDGDILDAQGRLALPGGGFITFVGHAGAEVEAVTSAGGIQIWLLDSP